MHIVAICLFLRIQRLFARASLLIWLILYLLLHQYWCPVFGVGFCWQTLGCLRWYSKLNFSLSPDCSCCRWDSVSWGFLWLIDEVRSAPYHLLLFVQWFHLGHRFLPLLGQERLPYGKSIKESIFNHHLIRKWGSLHHLGVFILHIVLLLPCALVLWHLLDWHP